MTSTLSYIEISQKNLEQNIAGFRKLIGPAKQLAAVVKANAYGHGLKEIVTISQDLIDYYQVDDLEELVQIRTLTNKPVLVLGYVSSAEIELALKNHGILAIYDYERLPLINKWAETLGTIAKVQVKIDTYLGRQGLLLADLDAYAEKLQQYPNIEVDGIYSHFANIEDTSDFSHAQKQIEDYEQTVAIFQAKGFTKIKKHISATSGILTHESNATNDLVRLGIGMYGLWPSTDLQKKFSGQIELKPILRWVTHLSQVKTVPANFPIGYGLTYITSKPMKIAVIPQGYSDGFDRGFSNNGRVLINNSFCPILGRVAMNMFVVDVSHLEQVKPEDEVIILGKQGDQEISAEMLAEKIGTINYEIIARISPLLPRFVV